MWLGTKSLTEVLLLTSLYTYTVYITIFTVCAIILHMLGPLLKFGFDYLYKYVRQWYEYLGEYG